MSVLHGSFTKEQRWLLPLAIAMATFIVAVGIPYQALFRQRTQLAASTAAIAHVEQQTKSLRQQIAAMQSNEAALALAREQWQLVLPHQGLIQVLPGANAGSTDPGFQPVVNPGGADLAPSTTVTRHAVHAQTSFFTRFVNTLEFWR